MAIFRHNKPLIIGNWKMHGTLADAIVLASEMAGKIDSDWAEVVLCPPAVWIYPVAEELTQRANRHGIKLGIQNIYPEKEGSFTGEISAAMVKNLVDYVIIGHSERRQLFGETDEIVNQKIKAVLAEGVTPVVCVGEQERTMSVQKNNKNQLYLSQAKKALDGLNRQQISRIIFSYEPVWAVGSGDNASATYAAAAIFNIRQLLLKEVGLLAEEMSMLYGGSVTAANAQEYLLQPEIDGLMVATASLKAKEFIQICRAVYDEEKKNWFVNLLK